MDYTGTIIDFDFHPMVEFVDSTLQITVDVPQLGRAVTFEDRGSIKYLSGKYGFTIESDSEWDFTGFKGQRCVIRDTPQGFRMVRFID